MEYVFAGTIALVLTAVLIGLLRPLAPRIGLIDRPNERKNHTGEVPLVGGIAVATALLVALNLALLLVPTLQGQVPGGWGLLVGGLSMLVIGIWDDLSKVSSGSRLLLQAAAVVVLAYGSGVVITDLGRLGLGGEVLTVALALPFTVFCGVGVINAINMSDGMDGLCGMLSLVAVAGLGLVAAVGGRPQEFMLTVAMAGAIIGFLAFNFRFPGRKQASAFLGDGGSYLLGILFVYLTVRLSQGDAAQGLAPAMTPVTALWILLVPLLDTVGMILRRLHRGRSPFAADREHLHHVFLLARFTVTETVLIIGAVALTGVVIGLGGLYAGVPESLMLAAFLVVGIGYYWMIMRAWKVMRFLSRSINRRMGRGDRRVLGDRRRRDDPAVVARLGYDRRSGLDRRRGQKDRRRRAAVPPVAGTALQHRDYPAGGHARRGTEHSG